MSEEVKVSQLPETETINDDDILMIVQNNMNKKIKKKNAVQDLKTEIDVLSNSYIYTEIETKKFLYEPTNTHYWITKVPYQDEDENIIEIKHGFANDEISDDCIANETPRSFARRHNATLCVNASIAAIENNSFTHLVGPIIHDGQIISEYGTDGYVNINQINVLAFDRERNFKVYPVSTSASTILLDGYTETIVAFDELVSNGEIINNGSSLYQWNIIAFNENTKDLYFCCCNGKNINDEEGMSLQTLLNILVNDYNCTFAYRLDQGGSTSLIKDNIMLNQPTDDNGLTERMTADYLYFSKDLETDTDKNINEITSMLSDIEMDVKKNSLSSRKNLTNIQINKTGKTIIVNIFGSFSFTVDSATAEVLGTIPEGYRPSMSISGTPVIAKTTPGYVYCPNCYIQIRSNGSIEFYQCSGSQQSIIQIIGNITYTID